MRSTRERHRWNRPEDVILKRGLRAGLTPAMLSHRHLRSPASIEERVRMVGWREAVDVLSSAAAGSASPIRVFRETAVHTRHSVGSASAPAYRGWWELEEDGSDLRKHEAQARELVAGIRGDVGAYARSDEECWYDDNEYPS